MSSLKCLTKLCFLVALAAAATGCASVKVSVPNFNDNSTQVARVKSERVALVSASQNLADTPWGEDSGGGMMSMVFGTVAENARERAVSSYLDGISGSPEERVNIVFADVDHTLAQARHVAEAGRQAVQAITPVQSDIETLEAAIGDVRESRTMYTQALEQLAHAGAPVTRDEIRVVRDAFTQTINDIGYTADIVAVRLRETRAQSQLAAKDAGLNDAR